MHIHLFFGHISWLCPVVYFCHATVPLENPLWASSDANHPPTFPPFQHQTQTTSSVSRSRSWLVSKPGQRSEYQHHHRHNHRHHHHYEYLKSSSSSPASASLWSWSQHCAGKVSGPYELWWWEVLTMIILTIEDVMVEIEDAGWKQVTKTEDKSSIKEEEVRSLFNMIDKDKSGSLSKRVTRRSFP